jgi:hypothetical protein
MKKAKPQICSECNRRYIDVPESDLGDNCYECWKKERI